MHDLGFFRSNLEAVAARLALRGFAFDIDEFRDLDRERRAALTESETLKAIGRKYGKSAAQVRMHYTNVHEAKLAFESLTIFQNWSEIVGGDCGFRAVGYVQIAPEGMAERMAIFRVFGTCALCCSSSQAVAMSTLNFQ